MQIVVNNSMNLKKTQFQQLPFRLHHKTKEHCVLQKKNGNAHSEGREVSELFRNYLI